MPHNAKWQRATKTRQNKEKASVIAQLAQIPIMKVACERSGVSRATYYRWYEKDPSFKEGVDSAIGEGISLLNDMAEYQLLSLMKDKNWATIRYWLEHNHPKYMHKNSQRISVENSGGSFEIITEYNQPL